jgi:hypothetical protein
MTEKKISIKERTAAKRSRARGSKRQNDALASASMMPLMRCSHDPNACPASGSIVALFSEAEKHPCIVCGRVLRIRGRITRSGQRLGRVPSHRRADFEQRAEARARVDRLGCRFDQAEKTARESLSRRALARAANAAQRARAIAERLPNNQTIQRRLDRLNHRVLVARTKAEAARSTMPKHPKSILREIVNASAIDIGAVEPDTWIDHLSAVLPKRTVIPIARELATRWIRLGLLALLRRAAPKTWDDLERRGFAGDRSVLAFIREFPGLELMRIPDHAYDASIASAFVEQDVPF